MSSLIVEVSKVSAVDKHPNADRMCILTIKGWKVVSGLKDDGTPRYKPGDLCVYVPPDAIMPKALSDRIEVTKYLKPLAKRSDGTRPPGGRVGVARLRGEPSYGLAFEPDDPTWPEGKDVAEHYGITKWEPPLECTDGDAHREVSWFHKYTDIENIKNFPDLFTPGELVIATEKIHGKNCRLGYGAGEDENGNYQRVFMAGSHGVTRKEFDASGRKSQFWEVFDRYPQIKAMLKAISGGESDHRNVVLFGEIYGSGVQDMTYGMENGNWDFRAFDISVNGKYLTYPVMLGWFEIYKVPHPPLIFQGKFDLETIERLTTGPTLSYSTPDINGVRGFNGREGIVIRSLGECPKASPGKMFDRVILKSISFEYLERKNGTEHK